MTSSFSNADHSSFGFHEVQPADTGTGPFDQLGAALFSDHEGGGSTVGTPAHDARDWVHQTTPFTCDVVSQEMILHEFGVDVSEAQLVYEATAHGWLTDSGTSLPNMAQLLESHGVHTHCVQNGILDQVASELAHGHKVIVAVDSGDLWNASLPFYSLFHLHGADHAVVLTGLDMSDPSHPKVFINDPGDPQGAGKPYPLDQFLESWGGSGNMYVATDSAPPHLANHLIFGANFHSDLGMYMDPDFWASFLKGLVPGLATAAANDRGPWHSGGEDKNRAGSEEPGEGHRGLF
jgi:hypothetical protein